MCNPRRVTITATRELDEAWERSVSRTVRLTDQVVGEARARQGLGETLSAPVRFAFEAALAGGLPGWSEVADGVFRHEVEGGHVQYGADDGVLEIVGRLVDEVTTEGRATVTIGGRIQERLETTATEVGEDDGFRGNTPEAAEKRAREKAERELEQRGRERVEAAARAAEGEAIGRLDQQAREAGAEELRRLAEAREAELRRQAAARLSLVGARARQVVSQALAHSYREAILAYARRQGAEGVQCREDDGTLEIEFRLRG